MSSTSAVTTFLCEYSILPEHSTRESCLVFFGGMTEEDDKKDLGDVKLLGRWNCVGEARGFCIAQAKNVVKMQKWLNNWVSMADIKVTPCLDDNQHREIILNKLPPFMVSYDNVGADARDGESLYFVKYQLKDGMTAQCFELFANMTEEQDQKDSGDCTSYGRWHIPSQGCGYTIASAPSAQAIYRWAYNWISLCNCFITPVTGDKDTREIIRSGLGFDIKHAALMEQLKSLMGSSGPCYLNAKFSFKSEENKQEFITILNSEDGLKVTRNWPGCESVECFVSHENSLELNIRQKWTHVSDHEKYLEMRTQNKLFASVMEMLSEPLEITHLDPLEL